MTTPLKLAVVTATIDPDKTREYWQTWGENSEGDYKMYVVWNGVKDFNSAEHNIEGINMILSGEILGPVAAFEQGVRAAAEDGADIIACFHDDLAINSKGWDLELRGFFESYNPLLVGFGGGRRLGRPGMYSEAYDPYSLARHDFVSNMRDAEAHGRRALDPVKVACLDGFSQVGRADFMAWAYAYMKAKGVIHHAYDSWLGVLAERWSTGAGIIRPAAPHGTWMLPLACHHAGGVTAVGNRDYGTWAMQQRPPGAPLTPAGDQAFWEEAHKIVYEDSRDILPLGW